MGSLKYKAHEKALAEQNQCGELSEKALEKMTDAFICKTDGSYSSVIYEFERQGYHLSEWEKECIKRITLPSDEWRLDGIDDEDLASISDGFLGASKEIIEAFAESEIGINDSGFVNSEIEYSMDEEEVIPIEPDDKKIHEIIEAMKTEW